MSAPKRGRLTGVESAGGLAYCAGERGLLLERAGPAEWSAVFTAGPGGDGRNVFDLSLTDDGERVWFCGAAGTLGHYDRATDAVHTHDAPYDITASFSSVSVSGDAGAETVHVADSAGEVVRGVVDGDGFAVRRVSIPGDGTALTEVVAAAGELFVADASGTFFHSPDGRRWSRRRLADATVRALAVDDGRVYEVAEDGTVFEEVPLFDPGADERNPRSTDSGVAAPTKLDAAGGAVAVSGGGGQLAISEDGAPFVLVDAGTDRALYGLELLDGGTILGVGTAGAIVEGVPQH